MQDLQAESPSLDAKISIQRYVSEPTTYLYAKERKTLNIEIGCKQPCTHYRVDEISQQWVSIVLLARMIPAKFEKMGSSSMQQLSTARVEQHELRHQIAEAPWKDENADINRYRSR